MIALEHHPSDADLVRSALRDREAFAPIVARYDGQLRRYIARLGLTDAEAAKDILQEAFIKAYLHLNDYDPSLRLSAWLYRITRNETMTHFRRQRNRPHALSGDDDSDIFERIADDLDIEGEASAAIDRTAVRAALEALDLIYRDVLVLRFFEEKSYTEISDILELPIGTVAAYLNRAKKKLKDKLRYLP